MKRLLFFCFCSLLFSCTTNPTTETAEVSKTLSKYEQLAQLYPDLIADTLYVNSAYDSDKDFPFKGRSLDSNQIRLLPHWLTEMYGFNGDVGASFKFRMDSSHTGFITRVPAEYVSSMIQLMIFDHKKDSVTSWIDLANQWGDAGDVSDFNSCLFKNEKGYYIVTYVWSAHYHSVDDTADTLVDHWYNYYLLKYSGQKFDTLSKDSTKIVNAYPGFIKKLSGPSIK